MRTRSLIHLPRLVIALSIVSLGSACGDIESERTGEVSSALRCREPDGCPSPSNCSGATGTLTMSPSTIHQGESTTLSWSAVVPEACTEQLLLDGVVVPPDGSKTLTPLASGGHVLRAGSKVIARARVDVILPSYVYIAGSTGEWRSLLVQAVGSPYTRVVLGPNVDMDLSPFDGILIADGVTLTSEAPRIPGVGDGNGLPHAGAQANAGGFGGGVGAGGAVAISAPTIARTVHVGGLPIPPPLRDAQHLGPRVFTTSRPRALFVASCQPGNYESNNIRIAGFRIEGPDFDSMEGDDKLERAIQIDSCLGAEIADMEIAGFSGAAIYVSDSYSRQFAPDSVRIHDNFIHHNQHVGGNGYGVDTAEGAWAAIEHNVFDFNRHAITSSGKPGTGYLADRNLILKGGGRHDTFFNSYTHLMDVHGDANCPDVPGNQHTWLCGNAGEQFWMTNNAFQYKNDYDIKIRGTPVIEAIISGNVFAQPSGDAIDTTQGYTNISVGPNTYGVDTFGDYGVCDIDGDGKDDLFLATGASWWFMSAAKNHWVYLSPHQERLSQVLLGDFNGDRRCDVVAKNYSTGSLEITSGATGDWAVFATGFGNIPFSELRAGDFNADGIADIFRRDAGGQWSALSPGRYGWTLLQSSSQALADLKLGDFNGDGFTDVLGHNDDAWAISWSARGSWVPAGSGLNDALGALYVGNVDGVPGDDVVRYKAVDATTSRWEISSGAHTGWTTLATTSWQTTPTTRAGCGNAPAACARTYLGRFGDTVGADVLALDPNTRMSRRYLRSQNAFAGHGRYAY